MSLVLTDDRTPFDIIDGKAKGTRGDAWSIQSPRAFRKRALMVVDALRTIGAGWSRIDDGGDLETADTIADEIEYYAESIDDDECVLAWEVILNEFGNLEERYG